MSTLSATRRSSQTTPRRLARKARYVGRSRQAAAVWAYAWPLSSSPDLANALVAKAGDAFLVCERDGSLPAGEPHAFGFYAADCRHLSVHELAIAGARPRRLAGSDAAGDAVGLELTNPEIDLDDGRTLALQSLRVRIDRRLLGDGTLVEEIVVHSYAREAVRLSLAITLAADFKAVLEIRGLVAGERAGPPVAAVTGDGVELRGSALDGTGLSTRVSSVPDPETVTVDGSRACLEYGLDLAPGMSRSIAITYAPQGSTPARRAARRSPEPAGIRSDDELFDRLLHRAFTDLRMLRSSVDGLDYYAAGIPWYATLFGRDSLIAAHQTIAFAPEMAAGTLRLLAGRLGARLDAEHDEEPGKVLHELRTGPGAGGDRSPLTRYYGTVDATPLFLCLLADHADWTGDLTLFRALRPAVEAALAWIDDYADADGNGLLDYRARSAAGLVNQGWKDSGDGVPDAQGDPLEPPIALVEVQGYAVRAKRELARLMELDGDASRAAGLRSQADALQGRLDALLWAPDRGHFGLALDGRGRLSPVLASNQGHLLWAGAVDPGRARGVRDSLMAPVMYSGWGIRTLAATEPAYNPVAYHLGSVWPHDNSLIAAGLREYGFDSDFRRVLDGLLDAAAEFDGLRLPELFAGFDRTAGEGPVPYPVACRPQAWAAGALPHLVQAALGLVPQALDGRLVVRRPLLPGRVGRLEVIGLRVGGARVDLTFEGGADGAAELTRSRVDGDLDVVVQASG